jgi:hypothetical protein
MYILRYFWLYNRNSVWADILEPTYNQYFSNEQPIRFGNNDQCLDISEKYIVLYK